MNNETTSNVRTYRDETRCAHCGRYIRNVVEIDGVQYGTGCAEAFLPRGIKIVKHQVVISTPDLMAEAKAELGAERFIRFYSQPLDYLVEYLESAKLRGANTVKGVSLIIRMKQAA